MEKKVSGEDFKPYIPADRTMPELTVTSVLIGVLIAIVFGAANAYLGLRVGMTIGASIPAAVISMGILRGILRRDSILENNMVQTIGSAGDSLAAGCIFTIPALFIWYKEWGMGTPSLVEISIIAMIGGTLGVLFMVPLRKALVVKEHGVLTYPEATACADVLLAGEQGGDRAKTTFIGLGAGAFFKFLADGIKLFPSEIEYAFKGYKGAAIGMDTLPALLGVGFIVGPGVAAYMLGGAVLGWFVLIPLISHIGTLGEIVMFPSSLPIGEMDHWGIWSSYVRYIGAGCVAFGGFVSLFRSIPLIVSSFKDSIKGYSLKEGGKEVPRTQRDLPMKFVLIAALVIVLIIGMLPVIPVGILGGLIIAVFGFFFATVTARVVGMIGAANTPISGITISTLLITAFLFKATGNDGQMGMIGTMTVGAVICIIAAIAGDTSQDLKTGFIVGSTPRNQQIGELLGVAASAVFIGGTLLLLNTAWGFGSKELPAPQATLMKMIVEGVMGGDLPWVLVFAGAGIGLALEILRIPVLPVAIGLYLPIHLSTPIMAGGLLRGLLDLKLKKAGGKDKMMEDKIESGVLFSSGLIAGEGLIGILFAVLAVMNIDVVLGFSLGQIGSLVAFVLLGLTLLKFSLWKKA